MKSCGVIAEYNPFHNGHQFHLEEAKRVSRSDVMIVAMSGNFTQRGEPAIVDKWQRAEMALKNGADIVLEQSVLGSVQATDLFAKAGVRLLQAMSCDFISFGAEAGTSQQFEQMAAVFVEKAADIDAGYQAIRNDGRSYPVQMEEVVRHVLVGEPIPTALFEPNSQLGLGYLKENLTYESPMKPVVLLRQGAGHNDQADEALPFASGTAIRQRMRSNQWEQIAKWVPETAVALLNGSPHVGWETYWPLLQYRIILSSPATLRTIYQMEEGIEHRLKKMAAQANSFQAFIHLVKNKRWTWTRLQRLCLYVLLDISKESVQTYFSEPPVIRILGFTQTGRNYLKALKEKQEVQIVTNISQKNAELLAKELQSDQVYQTGALQGLDEQNYTRAPIIF